MRPPLIAPRNYSVFRCWLSVVIVMVIAVMIAIAEVAVVVTVPAVVVLDAAVVSVPVARKKLLSVVMRPYPTSARIGRPGPVAVVPFIVISNGIPISFDPNEFGSRPRRDHMNYPRSWRRTNSDPD